MSTTARPLQSFLKYVDQPNFVEKLGSYSPWVLGAAGAGWIVKDVYQAKPEERQNTLIKMFSIVGASIAGALGIKAWLSRPNLGELREGLEHAVIGFKQLEASHSLDNLIGPETKELLQQARKQIGAKRVIVEESLVRHLSLEHLQATFKRFGAKSSDKLKQLIHHSKDDVLSVKQVRQLTNELGQLAKSPEFKQAYQEMLEGYGGLLKELDAYAKTGTMPNKKALLKKLESSNFGVFWPDRLEAVEELVKAIKSPFDVATQLHKLKLETQDIPGKGVEKYLLHRVIPDPENMTAWEVVKEIGDLSLQGAVPVASGVAGGVLGQYLTGGNIKEKFKDQSKEAFFQFFANIMLCNIGAGGFLGAVEMAPRLIKSIPPSFSKHRGIRAGAMITGIAATGIVGGSYFANVAGKNFVNRVIEHGFSNGLSELTAQIKEDGWKSLFQDVYSERRPGPLDVMLHADDVAIVALFSGLKWIEHLLPTLYSFSAIRAGKGYRDHKREDLEPSQKTTPLEIPTAAPSVASVTPSMTLAPISQATTMPTQASAFTGTPSAQAALPLAPMRPQLMYQTVASTPFNGVSELSTPQQAMMTQQSFTPFPQNQFAQPQFQTA